MKKPSKLALYALAASFFVVTTPLDVSYFPAQKNSLEKTILRCAAGEHPDTARAHTSKEIYQLPHEVYGYTFNKPDSFSEKLVRELIQQESGYNPSAKSRKGAIGLMQLTRDAWIQVEKECSYEYAFDPRTNIEVGIKYLLWLYEYCRENHPGWEELSNSEKRKKIMASYHGGIFRLAGREWDPDKMPEATRVYMARVVEGLGD